MSHILNPNIYNPREIQEILMNNLCDEEIDFILPDHGSHTITGNNGYSSAPHEENSWALHLFPNIYFFFKGAQ